MHKQQVAQTASNTPLVRIESNCTQNQRNQHLIRVSRNTVRFAKYVIAAATADADRKGCLCDKPQRTH